MRPQIVKIIALVLCLAASSFLFAAPMQAKKGPPEPSSQRTPGPELPIDDNIYVLVIAAIILGAYVAYRRHLAAKKAQ